MPRCMRQRCERLTPPYQDLDQSGVCQTRQAARGVIKAKPSADADNQAVSVT